MPAPSGFALLYEPDAFTFQNKIMGRQSAGIGFLRAVAHRRFDRVWCHTGTRAKAVAFARDLAAAGAPQTGVAWVPADQPERLAEAGLLYRPDPVIALEAWRRLRRSTPRAYSLCGVTHTIASQAGMDSLAGLLTAPVEEWDAVICTSTVARDGARLLLEQQAEYLRERLGASRLTLPQLPVIPLGVHCEDFTPATLGDRDAGRAALGIAPDRVVVLFVGRLSFHGKAHPLPMFLGLEEASRHAPITLLLAGLFPNEATRDAFAADARALCPSVDYRIVHGQDDAALKHAWAAADIFTSLSDNVQETFGLTPVEAMAAGLPVVVSDWNGYRDTVRDGIDGFRVPTLTPAPGSGDMFADRFEIGADDYDHYCGHLGQFSAVDVGAAGQAYTRLACDPALRAAMGAAGRARARAEYDWSIIFGRYEALWAELAERRRSGPTLHPPLSRRRRPDRPNPFALFATYPTAQIGNRSRFRRRGDAAVAAAGRKLRTVGFAEQVLPSEAFVALVLAAFDDVPEGDWLHIAALELRVAGKAQPSPHTDLPRALAWLTKLGVLDFSNGTEPHPWIDRQAGPRAADPATRA